MDIEGISSHFAAVGEMWRFLNHNKQFCRNLKLSEFNFKKSILFLTTPIIIMTHTVSTIIWEVLIIKDIIQFLLRAFTS